MREAPDGERLLATTIDHTPEGLTRRGLVQALELRAQAVPGPAAAKTLGSGYRVLAWDTVPFALLCASRHLDSYEEAFWATVAGLGDRDTTCAKVGGVVAMAVDEGGSPRAGWPPANRSIRDATQPVAGSSARPGRPPP